MQPPLRLDKYIKKIGRTLEIKEIIYAADILEIGKGHIFVTRQKRNGDIINASYLVDTYCLGVKDTFYKEMDPFEYEEMRAYIMTDSRLKMEVIDDHNYAFNLIYGAIEYAEDLGIEPHEDFSVTEFLLPSAEDIEYVDIEFGHNGRPLYISYLGDNKAEIFKSLNESVGPDGYDYEEGLDLDLDFDNDEFDEFEGFDEFEDIFANMPEVANMIHVEDLCQIALEWYDTEKEFTEYVVYVMTTSVIADIFSEDMDGLRHLYENNQPELLERIVKAMAPLDEEHNSQDVSKLYLSVVEKVLIYGDIGFLEEPDFLYAFKNPSEKFPAITLMSKINLSYHGDQKVLFLSNVLMKTFGSDPEENTFDDLRSELRLFKTKGAMCTDLERMTYRFILDHEHVFGEVDLNQELNFDMDSIFNME